MNHIIVPVDLSKNSKDALRYAGHLAERAGANILIIHSQSLLQKAIAFTTGKGETEKDPQQWILKRIRKLKEKHPGVSVDFKITKDDILNSLEKSIESANADLVVMGTQGQNENPDTFLGSTSG